MNYPKEMGAANVAGAVGQSQKLEIDREICALHDRLNTLDTALAQLTARLGSVMRASDPEVTGGAGALNPLTELGTLIRSATGRVEVHTAIVSDILHRLEIQ